MNHSHTEHDPPGVSLLPVLTAEEMRGFDRAAIDGRGIPADVLMENAGRAAADVVERLYPSGRVVAAIGSGNNGGDAVVLLRTLFARGRDVIAVLAPGAELPQRLIHGWEIPTIGTDGADAVFHSAGVLVDGLLGTGATGAPREPYARLIREMNRSGRPILALDGPSGVDMTTGRTAGDAIFAEMTVTFGALKRGLLLYPGRLHASRILTAEIGFPPFSAEDAAAALITARWAHSCRPDYPPNAHKGTLGRLVVVAGHPGMAGAATLVAMGALRSGVGGVRIVSPSPNRTALQTAVPEALFVDRAGGESLDEVFASADALVVGPGMGTDSDALSVLHRVIEHATGPILFDADAITLIAQDTDLAAQLRGRAAVLTPHPGEMSRLLRRETDTITADPFAAAEEAAQRFGCAVLLKGFPSLVAKAGQPTMINVAGHSGIATGGMGDTLAGVIGALLAGGAEPADAAAAGLYFSGRAAEIAGRGRSLLPRDVAEALPEAFTEAQLAADHPHLPGIIDQVPAPY